MCGQWFMTATTLFRSRYDDKKQNEKSGRAFNATKNFSILRFFSFLLFPSPSPKHGIIPTSCSFKTSEYQWRFFFRPSRAKPSFDTNYSLIIVCDIDWYVTYNGGGEKRSWVCSWNSRKPNGARVVGNGGMCRWRKNRPVCPFLFKEKRGWKNEWTRCVYTNFFHREFETFSSKNLLSSNETIQTDRSKLQFQFNIPWERVRLIVSRCHSRALFSLVGNFVVNPSREPWPSFQPGWMNSWTEGRGLLPSH